MKKPEYLSYMREKGVKNLCGGQVREARLNHLRERKMSQTELAKLVSEQGCAMNRLVIGRIENGRREVTDIELIAISRALEIDTRSLLFPPVFRKKAVGSKQAASEAAEVLQQAA